MNLNHAGTVAKKEKGQALYSTLLLGVSVIWGFGFIATLKVFDAGYTEAFLLAVRFMFAAVVFGITARKQLRNCQKSDVMGGLLGGVALFAGFALQTFGLPLTTPSNSAFLTASNLVFVPFFAWIVFKKRPARNIVIAAFVCFAGIVVLSVNPRELSALGLGDLLTFLCAISFAAHTVLMGYFALRGNPLIINFFQMTVSGILSCILLFWEGNVQKQLSWNPGIVWVLYLSIFSTVVAYFVQVNALKHLQPARASILMSTESVIAALFSLLLGYEHMRPALMVGGGLVMLSILLVEAPVFGKRKNRNAGREDA